VPRNISEDAVDNRKREECAQCDAFDYKTKQQYLELQFHFFIVSTSEDYGDGGDAICNPPPGYCYRVSNRPLSKYTSVRNSHTRSKREGDHCTKSNQVDIGIGRYRGSYTYRGRWHLDCPGRAISFSFPCHPTPPNLPKESSGEISAQHETRQGRKKS